MFARRTFVAIYGTISILMIHYFEQLTSSNDEAALPCYHEGDIIWAERQTAGRGQRGHTWLSGEGMNLTFSAVLEPTFLLPTEQFSLLQVVALALVDTLKEYDIEARIKWTNDIYVGDRKLVGILIEHSLAPSSLRRTIVGVGINVNQTEFDASLPNPVSMAQLLGKELNAEEVLSSFISHLQRHYESLREGGAEVLHNRYNELLYRKNEYHTYALPSGEKFRAKIVGTAPSGALRLESEEGTTKDYLFKEVEFIIF